MLASACVCSSPCTLNQLPIHTTHSHFNCRLTLSQVFGSEAAGGSVAATSTRGGGGRRGAAAVGGRRGGDGPSSARLSEGADDGDDPMDLLDASTSRCGGVEVWGVIDDGDDPMDLLDASTSRCGLPSARSHLFCTPATLDFIACASFFFRPHPPTPLHPFRPHPSDAWSRPAPAAAVPRGEPEAEAAVRRLLCLGPIQTRGA